MTALLYGMLGFACIFLYDQNNLSHNNDRLETLYVVGAGLLGLAYIDQIQYGLQLKQTMPMAVRVITGVLALAFFVLLVYVSLVTGGRTNWRSKDKTSSRWWEKQLVTTGAYAFCRHPSVWALTFFSLLLVPAVGFSLWYAILFIAAGLLLALYEDKRVFPQLMRGYDAYKKTTPFLFPNRESIGRCFAGKKAK